MSKFFFVLFFLLFGVVLLPNVSAETFENIDLTSNNNLVTVSVRYFTYYADNITTGNNYVYLQNLSCTNNGRNYGNLNFTTTTKLAPNYPCFNQTAPNGYDVRYFEAYDGTLNYSVWSNVSSGVLVPSYSESAVSKYYQIGRNGNGVSLQTTDGKLIANKTSNHNFNNYHPTTIINFTSVVEGEVDSGQTINFNIYLGNTTIYTKSYTTSDGTETINWHLVKNEHGNTWDVYKGGVLTFNDISIGNGYFAFRMNGITSIGLGDTSRIRIQDMIVDEPINPEALIYYDDYVLEPENYNFYTRVLSYQIPFTTPGNYTITRKALGADDKTNTFRVTTGTYLFNGTYQHYKEGQYLIEFNYTIINSTGTYSGNISQVIFLSDLYNPIITKNTFDVTEGFANSNVSSQVQCYDNEAINLNYTVTYNNNVILNSTENNNTQVNTTTISTSGSNTQTFICSDFFGSDTDTITQEVFSNQICLIDENNGSAFDINNVTSAIAYIDATNSSHNFQTAGNNCINYTTINNTKVRIELVYPEDRIITRWIDVSLFDEEVRVCAFTDEVVSYQQLIISASQRMVKLKSQYADCYVAADYTRFAYQDSNMLQADTIETQYLVYVISGGQEIILASVDGSIPSFINIDTIEFSQTAYNLNIIGDSLTFDKDDDSGIISILYSAEKDDNADLSIVIKRLDNNAIVFSDNTFADDNSVAILFDTSALSGLNESTLFQITATATKDDGTVSVIKRYFNMMAQVGRLNAGLVMAVVILMIFFGLTITAVNSTFGWFGIIIELAAIILTTFAISTWYIILTQAVVVIMMVFTVILMTIKNYREVG